MKYFAGLDVSLQETSVCVVDETGRICREMKVVSHPDDLVAALKNLGWEFVRIGLEAGPMSQWLYSGLAEAELPTVCIETRHAKAFL
jgi:transposase